MISIERSRAGVKVHSKLLAANNFAKLADAAREIGLADALEMPIEAALASLPRKDPWAMTILTAVSGRFGAKTLRELLTDPRPQTWLFGHGRERAAQVMALLRRYLSMRAKERGLLDEDEDEDVDVDGSVEVEAPTDLRPKSSGPERRSPLWPETESALGSWARENEVEEHLDDPISAAVSDPKHPVRHVAYGAYGRAKLRHVLVPASLSSGDDRALTTAELLEDNFSKKEIQLLREAAWSYLVECASEVRVGLGEERALFDRLEHPPEDPGERRLFDELLRARREVGAP